jgi:NAD(P)-dependent dehydrogenase (short-subunit alcohol dehydrogenase family)
MGLLDNKVAVVTGGTRGLGLAIAQAYAREGAAVMIASRSSASVEKAVALLRASSAQADGLACDVGDQAQVQTLTERAIKTFGQFDIWVNNAGLSAPYGPSIDVPIAKFEVVLRTNIWGTYYGSQAALKHFLPRRTGKLINLLGRGDKEPVPLQNAYASSKAWIRNFTLALAKEYKNSGVGVYAFNPGLVMTDMLDRIEAMEGYEDRVRPLETVTRMWGNPPEVPARRAVWLASAATDGRTGFEVRVLTPTVIVAGLLRELERRLMHRPIPPSTMTVASVPTLNHDQ